MSSAHSRAPPGYRDAQQEPLAVRAVRVDFGGLAEGTMTMTTATQAPPEQGERTVNLPFVSATFHLPDVGSLRRLVDRVPHPPLPRLGRAEAAHAARAVAGHLPPPTRLAYYAGLGVLGVTGVIEWPVAVAIGAGTLFARRARGARPAQPSRQESRGGGRPERPADVRRRTKTTIRAASTASPGTRLRHARA
ncbi:hypothetical protein [Phytohabitans kaempferiae]|uniref:Uncharacterized protein n=1 Tax=Phytohabitans kaempferiae TaxID=1620943 RepID=A0ABV6MAZ2_9ACTN